MDKTSEDQNNMKQISLEGNRRVIIRSCDRCPYGLYGMFGSRTEKETCGMGVDVKLLSLKIPDVCPLEECQEKEYMS